MEIQIVHKGITHVITSTTRTTERNFCKIRCSIEMQCTRGSNLLEDICTEAEEESGNNQITYFEIKR